MIGVPVRILIFTLIVLLSSQALFAVGDDLATQNKNAKGIIGSWESPLMEIKNFRGTKLVFYTKTSFTVRKDGTVEATSGSYDDKAGKKLNTLNVYKGNARQRLLTGDTFEFKITWEEKETKFNPDIRGMMGGDKKETLKLSARENDALLGRVLLHKMVEGEIVSPQEFESKSFSSLKDKLRIEFEKRDESDDMEFPSKVRLELTSQKD